MINFSVQQLEYLLAIERFQHFGRAAEACHVTQPTLSMQLQKLEDQLGAILIERSTHPIRLTEVGTRIAEQARVAMQSLRSIAAEATEPKKLLQGKYRLGVIPTLATDLIPLFIGKFAADFPKITLEIEEVETKNALRLLELEELDGALAATPLSDSKFQESPIFYEPFILYVSKQHPFAKRKSVHEEELDGKDVWLLKEGHCLRNQVIRLCSLGGKPSPFKTVTFEGGSLETLMRLVDQHGGYTLLPWLRFIETKGSKGVFVPFEGAPPLREVSLVTRHRALKEGIHEALSRTVRLAVPESLREVPKTRRQVIKVS